MHSSAVVLVAVGAVLAAVNGAGVKEKPGKGYFDAPSYPQQAAPAYAPQPPVYYQPVYQPPQYALPNVDVNYCTVHSSFPLVERRHKHRRDRRQAGYSVPAQSPPVGGYPTAPAYGSVPFPSPFTGHNTHHRFDREHCRYSAIWNQVACQTCCQVASAAVGTDTSLVTGGLFVFDPKREHGSFDRDHDDSKEDDKDDDKDKRVLQCICCLPKPV